MIAQHATSFLSTHIETVPCMYWVRAPPVHNITSVSINMIAINYKLLHCWLRHPSKDVLRAVLKHVKDFPSITIPPMESVCPGCQLGIIASLQWMNLAQQNHLNSYTQIWSPLKLSHITDWGTSSSSMMIICPWAGLSPYEPKTRPYQLQKDLLNMSRTSTLY